MDGQAYICSYECTFCSVCASESKGSCPNCTGELIRRPRRETALASVVNGDPEEGEWGSRPWLIWAVSFGVWMLVSLAASGSIYELYRARGYPMSFASVFASELSQILTYAPLTPLAFALGIRFPIQRGNWARRSLLHLSFALVFSLAHVILRGMTPYAAWIPRSEALHLPFGTPRRIYLRSNGKSSRICFYQMSLTTSPVRMYRLC